MYTINIGEYTVGSTVYEDRCLSASIGGLGLQCEEIPWHKPNCTNCEPWNYRAVKETVEETITDENGEEHTVQTEHYTGEFVLDEIPVPLDDTREIEIAELKQKLADTDYVIIKIAEGVATTEEYAEIIEQRSEWRSRINELV